MNIDSITIRKAVEEDRYGIARCIAEGFEKDFSCFSRNPEKVAAAIAPGIVPGRFHVAEADDEIIATVAVSDNSGRAVYTDAMALRRNFGLLAGVFARLVLKPEFEGVLSFPSGTGYIEFVAVKARYRRKGVASALLLECMKTGEYKDYVLDALAGNAPAVECYRKLGFREYARDKKRGPHAKVYMRLDMPAVVQNSRTE